MTFTKPLRLILIVVVVVRLGGSALPLLLLYNPVLAQERYLDPLFSDIEVQTGIEYGFGRRASSVADGGAAAGDLGDALLLDVYAPRGDTVTDRPVVILAFPGGFVDGARDTEEMIFLATQFAQRGYVAASIDYRLIENTPDSRSDVEIAILRAVHDMRAAVRFFREDAATNNVYGTDGKAVFVGGVSAGAVMAAVAGVLDEGDDLGESVLEFLANNGGMAGNSSSNTEYSSAVSGVLQISGAIRRLSWIEPGGPPIYAAHEEFDPVVPCGTLPGIAFLEFGLAITSSGACDMIPAAKAVGVPTEFFLVKQSLSHVGYGVDELIDILDGAAGLFAREVLRPKTLASAVLPGSRSVQVSEPATVFASVVNASALAAVDCSIAPQTPIDAAFSYQATDAANVPVGPADTPFEVGAGGARNFVLTFTPEEQIDPTPVFLEYRCGADSTASNVLGVNTLLLSASETPVADVIGLTTVVDLVAATGTTELFAVGSANVGAASEMTVSVDDGGAGLPAQLLICETESASGQCLAPAAAEVSVSYAAASTRSFAVFATPSDRIDEKPATNRVFVRFRDADNLIRGSTSSAIRTQ